MAINKVGKIGNIAILCSYENFECTVNFFIQ